MCLNNNNNNNNFNKICVWLADQHQMTTHPSLHLLAPEAKLNIKRDEKNTKLIRNFAKTIHYQIWSTCKIGLQKIHIFSFYTLCYDHLVLFRCSCKFLHWLTSIDLNYFSAHAIPFWSKKKEGSHQDIQQSKPEPAARLTFSWTAKLEGSSYVKSK